MAKMCPLDGCRKQSGLCIHDKMMIGVGMLMALAAGAHWGLHLF